MNFADIFYISRTGLLIYLKGSVATSDDSLSDRDPRIVVAEDTCIFLISGWIGGDFTKFEVISCISRLQDHNTIFGIQSFFYRIQSLLCKTFFYTDSGQNAEALWSM